jgi:hypothetical protein
LISFSDEFVSASFPSEAVLFDPKKSWIKENFPFCFNW